MRGRFFRLSFIALVLVLAVPTLNAQAGSGPKVKLVVRVTLESSETFKWSLNCSPNSGSHPSVSSACKYLGTSAGKKALTTKVVNSNCPQVFGGESKGRISGVAYGQKIALDLDRRDGCRISQWESLIRLLGHR